MNVSDRVVKIVMGGVFLAAAGGVLAAIAFGGRARKEAARDLEASRVAEPLPVYFTLPPFALTERGRQKIGLDSLASHVWIADFIFTRCAGPCPIMTGKMAQLQEHFAKEPNLRLVSITVDPTFDTPEVLQDYARRYRADPERWLFLTGEPQDVYDLSIKGFRMGAPQNEAAAASGHGLIVHSTKFALVDREGQVRGYYEGIDPESVDRLKADTKRLLQEEPATQPAQASRPQ